MEAYYDLKRKKEVRPETLPIYWQIYEITEKGKPYVIRENWSLAAYPIYTVKTCDWDINEINGIRFMPDNRQAIVNFSIIRNNLTPFGSAIYKTNLTKTFQAFFTLYDDGWRVEAIGNGN